MDALQELRERLDAVVRQLQEALSEAVRTRGDLEQLSRTSKTDITLQAQSRDEPAGI